MTYNEIISQVAIDLGLSRRIVDRTYRAYWKAIREHISTLPLKEDLSDEDFLRLQPNVNIPSIGKLYVTLDRFHRMKYVHNKYEEIKKSNKNVTHKED